MYHMLRCTNIIKYYTNALNIQLRTCNRDVIRMISYLVGSLITIILVTQQYPFYNLKKENHCCKLV